MLDMNITFAKRAYTPQYFVDTFTTLYDTLSSWISNPSYQLYLDNVGLLKNYFEPSTVEVTVRSILTPPFSYIKEQMDIFANSNSSFVTLRDKIYDIVNEIIDTSLLYLYGFPSSISTSSFASTSTHSPSSKLVNSSLISPTQPEITSYISIPTTGISNGVSSVISSKLVSSDSSGLINYVSTTYSTPIYSQNPSPVIADSESPTILQTTNFDNCNYCATKVVTSTKYTTTTSISGTVTLIVTEPCETTTFTEIVSPGSLTTKTNTLTKPCEDCKMQVVKTTKLVTTTEINKGSVVTVTKPVETTYTVLVSTNSNGTTETREIISKQSSSAIVTDTVVENKCTVCVTKTVVSSGSTTITKTSNNSVFTVTEPCETTFLEIESPSVTSGSGLGPITITKTISKIEVGSITTVTASEVCDSCIISIITVPISAVKTQTLQGSIIVTVTEFHKSVYSVVVKPESSGSRSTTITIDNNTGSQYSATNEIHVFTSGKHQSPIIEGIETSTSSPPASSYFSSSSYSSSSSPSLSSSLISPLPSSLSLPIQTSNSLILSSSSTTIEQVNSANNLRLSSFIGIPIFASISTILMLFFF